LYLNSLWLEIAAKGVDQGLTKLLPRRMQMGFMKRFASG
jgi:hypothetical protein